MNASAFPNYADDDFDGMDDFIPIDDNPPRTVAPSHWSSTCPAPCPAKWSS